MVLRSGTRGEFPAAGDTGDIVRPYREERGESPSPGRKGYPGFVKAKSITSPLKKESCIFGPSLSRRWRRAGGG
jgi:hypothetical protein